jgi:hypothetical protein
MVERLCHRREYKEGSYSWHLRWYHFNLYQHSPTSASGSANTSALAIPSLQCLRTLSYSPIAEWAGNGTVNLGAGAQVEYAYFTGTLDADGSSTGSNSTPGRAGTALGTLTDRRLKYALWQYPPQNGDVISYELSNDNGNSWNETLVTWVDNASSTSTSGIRYVDTTGNVSRFQIGRYRELTTNWVSTTLLRVKKVNPSSPVGFGLARRTVVDCCAATLLWLELDYTQQTATEVQTRTYADLQRQLSTRDRVLHTLTHQR